MAYCPICASEFPAGERCPRHGGLIEPMFRRETQVEYGNEPFVRAAVAWSDLMVRSWAELLRNNGIPAAVKTGGPGFSFGAPPPFGFACYIYVPKDLLARAMAVLTPFEQPGVMELSTPEEARDEQV